MTIQPRLDLADMVRELELVATVVPAELRAIAGGESGAA